MTPSGGPAGDVRTIRNGNRPGWGRVRPRSDRTPRRRSPGIAFACALVAAAACASNPPSPEDIDGGGVSHIERTLADYDRMGFLTGTPDFPVIGRVLAFRGPGDSAYVAVAASMSPAALHFARDQGLFAARYQVLAAAVSGADTVGRMDRRETVRIEDFAETVSDEERVFFQRFMTLPPGSYELTVTVRELTSRDQATRAFQVRVPPRGASEGRMTEPVVALRAVPRRSYRQYPPLIVSPRATVAASREPPSLVVEVYAESVDSLALRVTEGGDVLWEQELQPRPAEGGEAAPRTVLTALPLSRIPPGLADLTVSTAEGLESSSPLLVALDDVWAFAEWNEVVEHLTYALDSDSVDIWLETSLQDRARLWTAFWEATDLDPETLRNEFLARYFDRMSMADHRYEEPGLPGWRSDRGRAYVMLGRADEEIAGGGGETGEPRYIEWRYDESLPFKVALHYVDVNDFGVYRLDPRSRIVLRDAARRLAELERSGEWTDPRDGPEEDDEGIG